MFGLMKLSTAEQFNLACFGQQADFSFENLYDPTGYHALRAVISEFFPSHRDAWAFARF